MTNPTSNFGWQMPTNTDLVTDLPADFEVFGQAVDTAMADLKGGTTGQILAKATNTDMDFTWITNDVGDITAVNTTAPLAGGATSGAVTLSVTTATTSATGVVQLSDSPSTTSSVLAATPTAVKAAYDPAFTNNFYAGKNRVINGDFFINQRGFTSTTTSNTAVVDRFRILLTAAAGSVTTTVEQFTPGTAPVAGYEAKQYVRVVTTGQAASTDRALFSYYGIEDVRTFAGQTVTLSFWAKAASGTPSVAIDFAQAFGTGGSPSSSIVGINPAKTAITTSWARYSFTSTIPSISGKTVGTDPNTSALQFGIWLSAGSSFDARTASLGVQNNTFDIWGVQIEAGSTMTPFQTASGGNSQAELAMCQRYYFRATPGGTYSNYGFAIAASTTIADVILALPVPMRIAPTTLDTSNIAINDGTTYYGTGAWTVPASTASPIFLTGRYTHGSAVFTAAKIYLLSNNNNVAAYFGASAEL